MFAAGFLLGFLPAPRRLARGLPGRLASAASQALLGACFALLEKRLGLTVETFIACSFCLCLFAAARTDALSFAVPNKTVLAAFMAAIASSLWESFRAGCAKPLAFMLLGAAAGFGLLILPALKGAMGMGDVKLLAAAGAFLGPAGALFALAAASILGSLVCAALLASKKANRRTTIPFGPFLAAGAAIHLVLETQLEKLPLLGWL
jgi:prepilin signal peptidase PulO-like enzyme (type II secretory pathway)